MAAGVTITKLSIEVEASAAKAKTGLMEVDAALGRVSGNSTGAKAGFIGISSSLGALAAKAGIAFLALRKVAQVVASWINESNKYQENLNLFTVSMGQYAKEAQKYAETVSNALGLDPAVWMRNQGIFMTLLTGFGNVEKAAYKMSTNLTQLGYDLSSFFNISVEDAMQKLQSGISGELEPLRRLGYDLSQTRLQEVALANGITQTVASMNQAQKSQLRYIAIMTQVTTAQGDLARTLESPANQLRIFQAAVTQAARALGNIFIPALNAVLPYAIAFLNVIQTVANAIATLFGFKLTTVDYSGVDRATSSMDDLESATSGAGGAAKKLKSYLMGIDELNVISPDAGGGGGGGGGGLGAGFAGLELPGYDFLDKISSKVDEIKQKFFDFFSFLKGSPELANFKEEWKKLGAAIGEVFSAVGDIFDSPLFQQLMQGVIKLALDIITTALESISEILFGIADLLKGDGEGAFVHFGKAVAGVFLWVGQKLSDFVYGVAAAFQGLAINVYSFIRDFDLMVGDSNGAAKMQEKIDNITQDIKWLGEQHALKLEMDQQDKRDLMAFLDSLVAPREMKVTLKYATQGAIGLNKPRLAASGGVFNEGQMFIARENGAGPEMVGQFGSSSAVMNNDQIVDAVARGVASAVSAVMGSQSSGDTRPIILEVDGKRLATAVRDAEQASGYQMSSSTVRR